MKWWLLAQCLFLKCIGLALLLWSDLIWAGWLIFFSGGVLVVAHILIPGAQGLCDVVTRFRPKGREVWLTIDDGPDPEATPEILDLLDVYNAQATFFMIGAKAEASPDLVAAVRARGHSIGSHTQTHPTAFFWAAGFARVARELDDSLAVLSGDNESVTLYRSPVGIKNLHLRSALKLRGLSCIGWTIRTYDTFVKEPALVAERVKRALAPGAIILMHEGKSVRADDRSESIRRVLEVLKAEGYTCVLPEKEFFLGECQKRDQ
jgi:peptidoglycan/xylan/chitin deacetylase (PgdA/CDA1 family)